MSVIARRSLGVGEPGEEVGASAGAHLRREDRVAGGGAGGVGVHVLHGGDERGGVGEQALELADALVVLRPGDLGVLVAIGAAAVDRRLQHLLDAGDDVVALGAQVGKQRAGLDLIERAHQRRDLALVAVDRRIVDETRRQAERQRRLATHDLAHRRDLGVAGDAGDIAHDHPAHRGMAEIDAHVGDRTAAVPVEKLGDRAPRPLAVDGAVERLELGGVLRALRLGDRRRRQAVDAADALGDAAEDRQFAADGQAARADRRAAEGAVIVGVDETRRQRPPLGVDHPVGGLGLRPVERAQAGDDVVDDQRVA